MASGVSPGRGPATKSTHAVVSAPPIQGMTRVARTREVYTLP